MQNVSECHPISLLVQLVKQIKGSCEVKIYVIGTCKPELLNWLTASRHLVMVLQTIM